MTRLGGRIANEWPISWKPNYENVGRATPLFSHHVPPFVTTRLNLYHVVPRPRVEQCGLWVARHDLASYSCQLGPTSVPCRAVPSIYTAICLQLSKNRISSWPMDCRCIFIPSLAVGFNGGSSVAYGAVTVIGVAVETFLPRAVVQKQRWRFPPGGRASIRVVKGI